MELPTCFDSPLIRDAAELWRAATQAPFLEAAAAGTLPEPAFRRWLAQDYLFASGLTAYQAIMLAKAPRAAHRVLISGLAALDDELEWFESHAQRLGVELSVRPHPTCRAYLDFLMRSAYSAPWPVLTAILFGVEVSYLAAWSAFTATGPYAEFIARWSSPTFRRYVDELASLALRHPHEAAQESFNQVLLYERDFWHMVWEG